MEERDRIERDKCEKEDLRTQLEMTRLQLRYEQELRYKEEELRITSAQNASQNETTRADGTDIAASGENRRLVAISNSMPLNHYAVDVVSDLVNCVPLEKMLRQESNAGTATVSTVAEMFDKTMEKTPQLKQMIVARAGGSNLEFVLKQFRMKLFSRKEPGDVTMMACLILAMDQFCTGLSHKVKTGVIKAASLVHSDRLELISVVEDSGKLGPVPKEMKGMRLAELPGMIELFDGAEMKEFCSSFETLVMKYVCYEPDVPGKLRSAE